MSFTPNLRTDYYQPTDQELCLPYKYYQQSQLQKSEIVIPAKAGIQSFQELLDPRFRGGDTLFEFYNRLDKLFLHPEATFCNRKYSRRHHHSEITAGSGDPTYRWLWLCHELLYVKFERTLAIPSGLGYKTLMV